jgi:hypothetical protein
LPPNSLRKCDFLMSSGCCGSSVEKRSFPNELR